MNESPTRVLAVFDFDDTLIQGDSLWTFLALVAGWPRVFCAMAAATLIFAGRHFVRHDKTAPADRGTFFKQQMLSRLIAGRRLESLRPAVAALRGGLVWNEKMRAVLQDHHDRGHRLVIATGALGLYMSELARDLPPHDLLCTEIEVKDGVATGDMTLGNCVRLGKAQRVAAYMRDQGPFDETYGYGNYPDDVPMLDLMKTRVLV